MSGLAASNTDQNLTLVSKEPQIAHRSQQEDEDDEDLPESVKILKEKAEFGTITVWGHDKLPAADDIFAKGIEEWIAFAAAVVISPDGLP